MKKLKEDNSTKKLLDLIRTSEQKHTKTVDSYNPDISMPVAIKTKHLNLGVLITRNSLTLAMTSNKSFTKKKRIDQMA